MQQPEADAAVIVRNFERVHGRRPDLENPVTFNEKIIYRMIHDRRPVLTELADKLRARDYVAERIGADYLPTLYQACRSPGEIAWETLPGRFVIKANHGCGMNIAVLDKFAANVGKFVPHFEKWLRTNYYEALREWAYRDIRPAIFSEELLTDSAGITSTDWQFHTFDGRVEFLQVSSNKFGGGARNDYDRNLNLLPLSTPRFSSSPNPPKFPRNLDTMFSLAERLGQGLDYVRVDMYNLDGRIVFGEFTNYPGAGLVPFFPVSFDVLYGSKWRIPPSYG
jgi:hypothetical protein